MTRYEASMEKDGIELGLMNVFVVRRRDDGSTEAAVFLVDMFCLGVKGAFYADDLTAWELADLRAKHLPEERREQIHPSCAKKLIEGAVAYADTLGFAPHRDFRKARRVLSGIDATLCPTEFTFGCEGRPYYVQGVNDSDERIDRVLAILEARCGADGFDCALAPEENSLEEARLDLMVWLDDAPPEVPRFYQLAGMVTALHTCPNVVPPGTLLVALSARGLDWLDPETARQFVGQLKTYWNYIGELVHDATGPGALADAPVLDIWEEDFPEDSGVELATGMVEWAIGFLRTTELWPEAWGDAVTRPELAPHWEIVRWWANISKAGNFDDIKAACEATPPRTLATAAKALARALRPG